MSGLAGLVRLAGPPDLAPLAAMARALDARGPDARLDLRWPEGGLAVAVLAVDEAGGPPARFGAWTVAVDGQITNLAALLKELQAREVPVEETPAGVVAVLLEELGWARATSRLSGDAAIVAWDASARRLWLARDRTGVRPMHWSTLADGTVLFASEPRALLRHPRADRALDPDAVATLVAIGTLPAPHTPWRALHKLGPGDVLEADAAGVRVANAWAEGANPGGADGARARWARSLEYGVELAVRQRAARGAPLAMAASGGVFSAATLGAVVAARRREETLAITVGFDGGEDERGAAAQRAQALGAEPIGVTLSAGELSDLVDELVAGGEPPLDPTAPAWWVLARTAWARGARALVSGVGGAEVFGGHPAYVGQRAAAVPGAGLLGRALRTTGMGGRLDALGDDWLRRHLRWRGLCGPDDADPPLCAAVEALAARAPGDEPAGKALWLDRRLLVAERLAPTVDRAAGAHGLLAVLPLCDADLVAVAAQVPIGHLVPVRRPRGLFVEALAARLPSPPPGPRGMEPPLVAWLPQSPLLAGVPEALEGLLDPDAVRASLTAFREAPDHARARRAWTLAALARWRAALG